MKDSLQVTLSLEEEKINQLIQFCSGTKLNPQNILQDMISVNLEEWLRKMEPLRHAVPAVYTKKIKTADENGNRIIKDVQIRCLAVTNRDIYIANEHYYNTYSDGRFIYVPVKNIMLEKGIQKC